MIICVHIYTYADAYPHDLCIFNLLSIPLSSLSLSPSFSHPLSPTHIHTVTQVDTLPPANIHTQQLNQIDTHQQKHTLSPSLAHTRSPRPSTYRLAFVTHKLRRFFLSDQHLFFARFFRRLFGRHFSVQREIRAHSTGGLTRDSTFHFGVCPRESGNSKKKKTVST